jgi:hypothetical protein
MSRTQTMLAAAVGSALIGSASYAAIAPKFVLVPTDPEAIIDNPALANYDVYDLQVSISGGDKWAAADLRAQLTTGTFYIPPTKDSNLAPSATDRNTVGTRYLRDDTFVGRPGGTVATPGFPLGTSVNVLGRSGRAPTTDPDVPTFPSNGTNLIDDSTGENVPANSMQLVDLSWGDTGAASRIPTDNVYTIARLTVTKNAQGTVLGNMKSTSAPSTDNFFTFAIPFVPEPTSVALMSLGLGAVALRRRK